MGRTPVLLVVGAATLALAGCQDAEEFWYKGTTKGYAICKQKALAQKTMTEISVQAYCLKRHEQPLNYGGGDGKAYFHKWTSSYVFMGNFRNSSTEHVITNFAIKVDHADKPAHSAMISNQWIEPREIARFTVSDLPFGTDAYVDLSPDKFEWWITDVKGLKVEF